MDKNIAAILREDTRTINVQFFDYNGMSKPYTYVVDFEVAVGDLVVVPSGEDKELKVAKVSQVDADLDIEPNCAMKFKWAVCRVDWDHYIANLERNSQIEKMLAKSYRMNARAAYAQQFLAVADPEVVKLVKGEVIHEG